VGKLVIGHYSSRYYDSSLLLEQAREVFAETYAAETGMEFEVPLIKKQYII
jgi:ribonuclease Z